MAYGLEQADGAKERTLLAPLFVGWEEMLVSCALEGCMGRVWRSASPARAALCEVGDFLFLAGEAGPESDALVRAFAADGRYHILASKTPALHYQAGATLADLAQTGERYAFLKETDRFDTGRLAALSQTLPDGVSLRLFDEDLYHIALSREWSRDFVSLFPSAKDYLAHGLGVAALYNGELVGGASSYAWCRAGVEIELDSRLDFRRRGIGAACAARLVLECLRRGLLPSWDAASRESARLAQRLGFREAGAYPVWFLNG